MKIEMKKWAAPKMQVVVMSDAKAAVTGVADGSNVIGGGALFS